MNRFKYYLVSSYTISIIYKIKLIFIFLILYINKNNNDKILINNINYKNYNIIIIYKIYLF